MIPWAEYHLYSQMAAALHCILWWHIRPEGDFQPFLMPVDEKTWRAIIH
jgi:hypothetical protein